MMGATPPDDSAWPALPRVRRAILVIDIVESVRLMQQHEDDVIDRWRRIVETVRAELLPAHGGRLVKSLGDGMLLEFEAVRAAAALALALQQRMPLLNRGAPPGGAIELRIGMHVADVVLDPLDIYGAGVNIAARLASAAQPGGIVVSAEARDALTEGLDAQFEDLGDLYLKHIQQPVRAYAATPVGPAGAAGLARHAGEDLRPAIAIVPFRCRDGSDAGDTLGDLIVDELTAMLSRSREWRVIAKLSAAAFTDRPHELAQIGSALRAQFVVTGAYTVSGHALRLQVQAIDLASADVLWADALSGSVPEVLKGSDALFEAVGLGLTAAIFGRGLRSAAALPLPQLSSHALLLGAVALMHRARRSEFDRALQMIEHLQERHPRSAQPHAWRAKWHVLKVVQGWSDDPARDGGEALQAGRRATDSDTASSLALTMQGLVHAYLKHDFDAARAQYEDALALNPNESLALLLKGTMHAFVDEGTAAFALTQQALALSPLDPLRYFYLSLSASAAIAARRFDDAVALAQRSLRANRTHLSTYRALAIAQSLSGRGDEARRTIEELLHYEPGFTVRRFLDRYPGREHVPGYTRFLADALADAGLPAG